MQKKTGPDCKCRLKCVSSIDEEFQNKILSELLNIGNKDDQVIQDDCSKCEELGAKIKSIFSCDSAKRAAEAELNIHKRRANKFFKAMQEAKERCSHDESVGAIPFDFMQNLPLPSIPVQEIFYMCQLWVNAFNIHDLKTGTCVIYLYHEGQVRNGANEVASFLFHYIKNFMAKNVTELNLFSDSCPGQNRNHTVLRLCSGLVSTGRLHRIVYKFPEREHSFLDVTKILVHLKRK